MPNLKNFPRGVPKLSRSQEQDRWTRMENLKTHYLQQLLYIYKKGKNRLCDVKTIKDSEGGQHSTSAYQVTHRTNQTWKQKRSRCGTAPPKKRPVLSLKNKHLWYWLDIRHKSRTQIIPLKYGVRLLWNIFSFELNIIVFYFCGRIKRAILRCHP